MLAGQAKLLDSPFDFMDGSVKDNLTCGQAHPEQRAAPIYGAGSILVPVLQQFAHQKTARQNAPFG